MTYQLSVKMSDGPDDLVFHVALDSGSAMPWVVAAVLIGGFGCSA
jgi:hypothetical protein